MKTAISIPDNVFASAEQLADRLGQSRSQLYTLAVKNYLAEHKGDHVTEKLDEVYDNAAATLDTELAQLQSVSLPRETW
jgi:metal-responsive CopG/Arc/MetJ family transcriptional regulator